MDIRVGEGWDIHRLVVGRKLILGGVHLPFEKGLLGHSDADALLHAMTDALLGAAGLGDIGQHFSDQDVANKDKNSSDMLKIIVGKIRDLGWGIVNIDSTIIAQAPKMAPHIDVMRKHISTLLDISIECVSIKAKTAEKLGAVGEGLAIEARAVVLISK